MEEVKVVTPAGEIKVVENPDSDYPGVWIQINGQDLVLVDYDEEEDTHFVRVWTKERDEKGIDPLVKIDIKSGFCYQN